MRHERGRMQSLDRQESEARREDPIWRTDDYLRFAALDDERVRAWALRRLSAFEPSLAGRLALPALEDETREVQRAALAAIASSPEPLSENAVEALRGYVDREDILPGLRQRAAGLLADRPDAGKAISSSDWSDEGLRERGLEVLRFDGDQAWDVLAALERRPWRWAAEMLMGALDDLMRGSLATEIWDVVEEIGDPDSLGRVLQEWRLGEPRIAETAVFLAALGDRQAAVPDVIRDESVAWREELRAIERVRTADDVDRLVRDAPLTLRLRCTACGHLYGYTVRYALLHPEVFVGDGRREGSPDAWDGVVLSEIIECKRCAAEDHYELTGQALLSLSAAVLIQPRREAPVSHDDHGVFLAAASLWDGTIMHRPSEGIRHLRTLAEKTPQRGEPWRRLGNLCERYGRMRQAEEAWRRAVGDESEMEAAYSLAVWLGKDGRAHEGIEFLLTAIHRLPEAKVEKEARRVMAAQLCDLLRAAAPRIRPPLALMACWSGRVARREAVVHLSSLELTRIRRWDRLAELLGDGTFTGLQFTTEMPVDDHPQLEALLDGDGLPAPWVRVAPRVGRNEPCSCGSGKKYKRCCLRRRCCGLE